MTIRNSSEILVKFKGALWTGAFWNFPIILFFFFFRAVSFCRCAASLFWLSSEGGSETTAAIIGFRSKGGMASPTAMSLATQDQQSNPLSLESPNLLK